MLRAFSCNFDDQLSSNFVQVCNYFMHLLGYTKWQNWSFTITKGVQCLYMWSLKVGCRGRADNSTWLKLWCFCSAECDFQSLTMTSVSFALNGTKSYWSCVLCNVCKILSAMQLSKREGVHPCFWWQQAALQHLVNHHKVLHVRKQKKFPYFHLHNT